jgi:hypothetical protein
LPKSFNLRANATSRALENVALAGLTESPAPNVETDADQLDAAADQAIAACGGDAREAVKASNL